MIIKRKTKEISNEFVMVYVVFSTNLGRLKLKVAKNSKITTVEDLGTYLTAYYGCLVDVKVCLSSRDYFSSLHDQQIQIKD